MLLIELRRAFNHNLHSITALLVELHGAAINLRDLRARDTNR